MPNTYSQILYHIVFATKHRRPLIMPDLEERLYGFLGGIVRRDNGVLLAVGGMPDHVHLLVRYRTAGAIADLVRELKSASSGWVHDEFPALKDFAWQEGYGVFTVSQSAAESVKAYIHDQKEHHRGRDFKEEFLAMLRLHGVDFDERFVFD
jgi:putative transposase